MDAFAFGYRQGKTFAAEYAYGLGFADGENSALKRKTSHENSVADNAEPKRLASKNGPLQSDITKRKKLYGLPCAVCGALYIEGDCPLCKRQNHSIS